MDHDEIDFAPAPLEERASALHRRGKNLYRKNEHAACATTFAELAKIEEQLGRQEELAEARFWHGAALHGRGQLTDALGVFTRSIEESELTISSSMLYMTISRFLRAMIERPFPLLEILDGFEQLETLLAEAGIQNRRSRLLLTRARLALSRGRAREALAFGERSLEAWRRETFTFTGSSHYWVVTTAALWLDDLPRARRHLSDWEALGEDCAMSRVFLATNGSILARREGENGRAISLGRRAWREAARGEDHQQRFFSGHAYVRALLLAGRLPAARDVLVKLFEGQFQRDYAEHGFVLRALQADWHLTRARLAGGLALVDPETGLERRSRRGAAPPRSAAAPALARARALYRRARRLGDPVDRLLATALRRWEIDARLALCDRTERELG
jgi:tetratricopeptide (TPR) repeat protein